MKKPLLFLALLGSILFFNSCQKELSVETGSTPSGGSLQSDLTGDCLPKTVAGVYEAGKALNATSNYIEVQVNVTTAGAYVIGTDTTNGIWFRSVGVFTSTGLQTVRLKGNGTPSLAGTMNYIVTYNTSECAVAVLVLPAGGNVPAVFQLAGAPNACIIANVNGTYVQGTALTIANTVDISVNVTTMGTYNITTPVSNGIIFTGQGVVNAGAQTITLTASGTPAVAGTTNIVVTVGTSTCSFTVTVNATAPAPGDYFPRTVNSNWSYESDGVATDSTLIKVITDTKTIGGNVFNIFMGTNNAALGFDTVGYFRKAGGSYSRFENLQDYLSFDNPQRVEFIFLKDDQPAANTWTTAAYTGAIQGVAVTLRIKFTILQKDVAVSVKGTSYPNTIVVEEKYEINTPGGWVDATPVFGYYKDYYAKNVGWILDEYFDETGAAAGKLELRRHLVYP